MAIVDIPYEQLPQPVKNNLSREQWVEAQREVIREGDSVPEKAQYINLKNGLILQYEQGEPAQGPLLPVADLSGGGGKDSTQFHTAPPGATGEPRRD